MRSASAFLAAVLLSLLGVVLAAPAHATPMTDQYTEPELPNPGGPENDRPPARNTDRPKPVKSGNANNGDNGTSTGETGSSYSGSGYDSSSDPTEPYSGRGSANQSGSNDEKGKQRKAGNQNSKPDASERESRTELAGIAPSGGSGGDGMGVAFPLAIVVVAGLVGGYLFYRRKHGTLTD